MSLVPDSIEATSPPRSPTALKATSRIVTLEARGDGYALDGIPKSAEELRATLREAGKAGPPVEVLTRVPPSTPFEMAQQAVRIVRGSGIATIHLA
jgi:hypothetical protein